MAIHIYIECNMWNDLQQEITHTLQVPSPLQLPVFWVLLLVQRWMAWEDKKIIHVLYLSQTYCNENKWCFKFHQITWLNLYSMGQLHLIGKNIVLYCLILYSSCLWTMFHDLNILWFSIKVTSMSEYHILIVILLCQTVTNPIQYIILKTHSLTSNFTAKMFETRA
jgi:hypothetical protein